MTTPTLPDPPITRPRVVVTHRLPAATEARMAALFEVRCNAAEAPLSRDKLIAALAEADVLVPTLTDRIDRAVIAAAGPRLRLIANFGAGTDHIDVAAARARRIIVTNTPGVLTDDTADMAMALIVMVARQIATGARLVREGAWQGWSPSALLGHRIGGKRLAIIGMGRIGQAVAHRARGFGLTVGYHNRHRLPAKVESGLAAQFEPDLDRLVAGADILSLHCPATPETHHILSARRIATMKPTAHVVNTARGELIDEEALIAAVEGGRLAGAALDVLEHEPAVDPRLLALSNVLVVPHMGSATVEGREASGERVIANIRFWADGHRPPDQVLDGLV